MQDEFDLIKVGILQMVDDKLIHPSVHIDRITADFWQIALTGRLIGQKFLQHYEFKCPLNWLEAVKERFFPDWLLIMFPVKYRIEVVDIEAMYPELHKKLKLPDEPHFFDIVHYVKEQK